MFNCRRHRRRAAFCILHSAFCILLILGGCARRKPPPAPPPRPPAEPLDAKLEAHGIHWSVPDLQDRPLWEVDADKASAAALRGVAEFEGVRCKVYSEGKLSLEATAPRVRADVPGKSLTMLGGVSARSTDGKRSFRARELALRVKEGKRAVVEAVGDVKVDFDGTKLEGGRLVTNPKLTEGRLSAE